ncbi:MAG: hypothetical protein WCX77_02245 [Candidatus Paceibacterota bacterium]
MEIMVHPDYRLQFQKSFIWDGNRWYWKITGWTWVSAKDFPQKPPKTPPIKFYLLGFRKSDRTWKGVTRKKIVGAYYAYRQGDRITVVYRECVP